LFSFLIVSTFSYTAINANNTEFLPESSVIISNNHLLSIIIPATTIDIQDGQDIIQFDLSNVDIGEYQNIQNILLTLHIDSDQSSLDLETLRNDTTTSMEQ